MSGPFRKRRTSAPPTEQERRAFELGQVRGLNYTVIGKRLGVTSQAAYSAARRYARKTGVEFKRRYAGPDFEDLGADNSDDAPKCRCGLRLPCHSCVPRSAKEIATKGMGAWQ